MSDFFDLPVELQSLIIDNLSLPDMTRLSAVSQDMKALENDHLNWQNRLKTNFPHIYGTLSASDQMTDYKALFKKNYPIEYTDLTPEQRHLFSFVKEGDIESLKKLVIRKRDLVSLSDTNELNLLDWANINNKQAILNHFFELILKESHQDDSSLRVDPNEADMYGFYLLHWAVLCNQPGYIETLLAAEANAKVALNKINMRYQPLHLAAQAGQLDIVKALVENDPLTLDEPDACGQTALLWASANGQADVVEYLLEKKPNLEAASIQTDHEHHGKTSLYWAVLEGHTSIVEKLMTKGANAKVALGDMRVQPLHLAAQAGQLDMVKALIENDPSTLEESDALGQTALLWASTSGQADIVKYLFHQAATGFKTDISKSPKVENNFKKFQTLDTLAQKIIFTPRDSQNKQRNNLLEHIKQEAIKVYQQSHVNVDQKRTKLQTMSDKLEKLHEFTERLKEISLQAKNLRSRGHGLAATHAETLATNLQSSAKTYINDLSPAAYETFRTSCSNHIQIAKTTLERHKGWKCLLGNLGFVILGAGVGYVIAGCINKAVTGNFLFFNKKRSEKKLDALSQTLSDVETPISIARKEC